ncbi:MAG: gamma-glutamyl-gamma-aminobutyrate hydrolase family protein, partial [Apilactobacillus sp.]|nr:gamma-glutamyl-gamma-aminobutyrate hydrolase family protein [Apilactobacillus sp.]
RSLAQRNLNVTVFPSTSTAEEILASHPDGILLSNGPGDPKELEYVLPVIRELEEHLPILGICLGHQLFALANGANTYKMKFGHRGFNHAIAEAGKKQTYFTSQ